MRQPLDLRAVQIKALADEIRQLPNGPTKTIKFSIMRELQRRRAAGIPAYDTVDISSLLTGGMTNPESEMLQSHFRAHGGGDDSANGPYLGRH